MKLIHNRGLFPEECFEKRNFSDVRDDALRMYSRNEGIATPDSNPNEKVQSRRRVVQSPWAIKVLAQGKSSGSDQLLDWLVSKI